MQVCQTWQAILTPLLWMAYDSTVMVQWQIPLSTFVMNSHHFQYLNINVTRPESFTLESLKDLLTVAMERNPSMAGMEWLKELHMA